jgi:hypothetical protein
LGGESETGEECLDWEDPSPSFDWPSGSGSEDACGGDVRFDAGVVGDEERAMLTPPDDALTAPKPTGLGLCRMSRFPHKHHLNLLIPIDGCE